MHNIKYHLIVLSLYQHRYIYQLYVCIRHICLFTSVSITTCTVEALTTDTGDAIWKGHLGYKIVLLLNNWKSISTINSLLRL